MDTMQAFARGEAARGNRVKVFDWHKAAQIIRDRCPSEAGAGLSGDWEWTGGSIWRGEGPVPADDTYTYLSSTWATPELSIGAEYDGDRTACWTWADETDGWDSGTYWPQSALNIVFATKTVKDPS